MKKLLLAMLVGVTLLAFVGGALAGGRGHSGRSGRSYSSRSGRSGHSYSSRSGLRIGLYQRPRRSVFFCPPRKVVYRPPTYVEVVSRGVVVSSSTVSVWVSNGNGSRVEVLLTRCGSGYTWPRGEYYSSMPCEAQLRPLYAIRTEIVNDSAFTVWITNDNGSQTSVILRPQGTGFVGPSNEYYAVMPTEEQLKALYGLQSTVQQADTVTVWLSNCYGTKISVVLTKDGSQYIGPKGERYPSMPTEEQLKLNYGK